MNVVITGGAGFLGTRLARKLLERNTLTDAAGRTREIASITLLDIAPAAVPGDKRVTSIVGDLGDASLLERAVPRETDTVFHLAAVVSGQAEAEFDVGMRVNLDATRALLERCRKLAAPPKFVFTSSLAVFGGPVPDPVPDDAPLMPQASYGTQKAIGEYLVFDMTRKGMIDGRSRILVRERHHPRAAVGRRSRLPGRGHDPDVGAVAARGHRQPDRRARGARVVVRLHALDQRAGHLGGGRRHGEGLARGRRRGGRVAREVELRPGDRQDRVDVAVALRAEARTVDRDEGGRGLRGDRPRVYQR